jgi:hypothetical protein
LILFVNSQVFLQTSTSLNSLNTIKTLLDILLLSLPLMSLLSWSLSTHTFLLWSLLGVPTMGECLLRNTSIRFLSTLNRLFLLTQCLSECLDLRILLSLLRIYCLWMRCVYLSLDLCISLLDQSQLCRWCASFCLNLWDNCLVWYLNAKNPVSEQILFVVTILLTMNHLSIDYHLYSNH